MKRATVNIMTRQAAQALRRAAPAALLALGACVAVPEPFRGDFPALTPGDTTAANVGERVRWGGVVLETRPEQDRTCFEVLSRRLSSAMRPTASDQTQGRFIACKPGFHDPEVFARGREMTLTGSVERIDLRKVGEFDYRYPVLAADFVTLWPERRDVIIYDRDPFFSPWYWHYPYGYPIHHPLRPHHRRSDKGAAVELPRDTTIDRDK